MRRYTGNEFIENEYNRIFVNNFRCHLLSSNFNISVTCNFHNFSSCLLRRLRDLQTARDGSRTAATSEMERFVIIVNGFQPLTSITKRSILDISTGLDPPLIIIFVTKVIRLEFLSTTISSFFSRSQNIRITKAKLLISFYF